MRISFKEENQRNHDPTGQTQPVKYWMETAKKLGVKDFSAFIRGAVNSAVFVSSRAQEPKWQEFVEAVQPAAKRILGHGFYDGGAEDFESSGRETTGTPARETLRRLRKKHGPA